jgi:hypothetical protein
MQRMLIIIAVLLVAWRLLAAIGKRLSERSPGADSFSRFSPEARRRRPSATEREVRAVEDLVECSVCGVFVPSGRALTSGEGTVFCSDICRHRAKTGVEAER